MTLWRSRTAVSFAKQRNIGGRRLDRPRCVLPPGVGPQTVWDDPNALDQASADLFVQVAKALERGLFAAAWSAGDVAATSESETWFAPGRGMSARAVDLNRQMQMLRLRTMT